ncbi:tautomerase family protein [Halalkalibacterium ligniniphilum]|uniref:tautomerase family protein n=1 Tax=Halalkalibacterium ligniniphilum TaxID=1134413 RepID=UPI00037479AD|nr:hypothetical protein [Halalkalibacterium ligniniphilum]
MKKWISCCLALLLFIGGCSQPENPEVQGVRKNGVTLQQISYGLFGPGPINYGEIRKPLVYNHQGEENTSTSFRTMNRGRQHLGDDQERIRSIIQDQFDLNSGMVIIAGSHAWVNVKFPEGISREQKDERLAELEKALQQGIPRYRVHVNEEKS